MPSLSKNERKEINYLNTRNDIRDFVDKNGYSNIIRYMIDQLDIIDDLNNTQSMELFKLISSLESALKSYERLQEYV
jgi:hypothetical protein